MWRSSVTCWGHTATKWQSQRPDPRTCSLIHLTMLQPPAVCYIQPKKCFLLSKCTVQSTVGNRKTIWMFDVVPDMAVRQWGTDRRTWDCLPRSSAHFLIGLFVSVVLSCVSFLHILDFNLLQAITFASIFPFSRCSIAIFMQLLLFIDFRSLRQLDTVGPPC